MWIDCVGLFRAALIRRESWPSWAQLRAATKGRYALHSQTVQAIAKSVQTAFVNARILRREHPEMKMRYPWRRKHHYALLWPAQAVKVDQKGRILLPMGKSRPDLVLDLKRSFPFPIGACKLVWKDRWELHVCSGSEEKDAKPIESPGTEYATVDLGEIHLAATTTSTGKALVMSGRGIRSIKRRRCKALAGIASLRSRCKRGSRRDKRLARTRCKISSRTRYQVRDLRHKGLKRTVDFCVQEKVGKLFVGNPGGVRLRHAGSIHNGRMARWEYGTDLKLLAHKCSKVGIVFESGSERGTSSRCPVCEKPHRPKGRTFRCPSCNAVMHRDVVGSLNMHALAFSRRVPVPEHVTYLRPGGPLACPVSSSRPDTGLCSRAPSELLARGLLSCSAGDPPIEKTATQVGIQDQGSTLSRIMPAVVQGASPCLLLGTEAQETRSLACESITIQLLSSGATARIEAQQ